MITTRFISPGLTLKAIASEKSSGFYAVMFTPNSSEEDIINEIKRIKCTGDKPTKKMKIIINGETDEVQESKED